MSLLINVLLPQFGMPTMATFKRWEFGGDTTSCFSKLVISSMVLGTVCWYAISQISSLPGRIAKTIIRIWMKHWRTAKSHSYITDEYVHIYCSLDIFTWMQVKWCVPLALADSAWKVKRDAWQRPKASEVPCTTSRLIMVTRFTACHWFWRSKNKK